MRDSTEHRRNRAAGRAAAAGLAASLALLPGCGGRAQRDMLGSAVVEAQTYQVGATVQGQVASVLADEGQAVAPGQLMAVLDSVPYRLLLDELQAAFAELQSQVSAAHAQLEAAKSEVRGLKRELDRIRTLVDKGSAPAQQKDQLETQHESASFRVKAATASLAALSGKRKTLEARQAQLRDQIGRCSITAPAAGTVITRYRALGEVAGPAAPLFEIASYDTVWADFFVPQTALGALAVGQAVRIRVDTGDGASRARFVPAAISWISDDAEFSPKNVQTRQARNELVFRVRARAANPDRFLKRGLPVEVWRGE